MYDERSTQLTPCVTDSLSRRQVCQVCDRSLYAGSVVIPFTTLIATIAFASRGILLTNKETFILVSY